MLQRLVSAAVVSTLLMPVALSAASVQKSGTSIIVRPRSIDFVDVNDLNDIDVDFEDAVLETMQTW